MYDLLSDVWQEVRGMEIISGNSLFQTDRGWAAQITSQLHLGVRKQARAITSMEKMLSLMTSDWPLRKVWSWGRRRSSTLPPRTRSSCPRTTGIGRCSWLRGESGHCWVGHYNRQLIAQTLKVTLQQMSQYKKRTDICTLITCGVDWRPAPCPAHDTLTKLKLALLSS